MEVYLSEHIAPSAYARLARHFEIVDNFDHPERLAAMVIRRAVVPRAVIAHAPNLKDVYKRQAHSRVHKGMLVAKFADYDDVNAAMTLKNRVVSIARADVTLPDGQYFQQDLIGIAVETDAGEPLGTLREILDLPRGSVYVVQGAREVLIPDRPEFVCSIDPAAGRMVVHLIEGM